MTNQYKGTCRWCGETCHPDEIYHPQCKKEKDDEARFDQQREEAIQTRTEEF